MKYVPYGKLSKKKKRLLDLARRGGWGGMSPVTRREKNPKAYKRKKIRLSELNGEPDLLFRIAAVTKQSPFNGTMILL